MTALLLTLLLSFWAWTPDLDRATLEARYLRAPTDLVEVAGTRLHVRDEGPTDANEPGAAPATTLVLLHGFGASLHTWDDWAPALAQRHRVIRFDLPGSGLSPPDATGRYTDARSIELLLALLDQRGIARADVVGHSIGGRLAWTLAAQHPERVGRLVLLAPDGYASPGFAYGQAPAVPTSFQLMRQVLPRPVLRWSLAPAFADPAHLSDALMQRYFDLMRAPGSRQALLDRMAQTVLVDPAPWLARITAPTLLVWGSQDAMIPPANAADYLRALPSATLVTLPGVGHLAQEEMPARGLAAVLDFLR
jgi:pimeloyl-ACP methyl ester carboxylesterase